MPESRRRQNAARTDHEVALRLDGVSRIYRRDRGTVTALRDVSIDIPAGTFTAVMGRSGSGKSTFLQCAAGLDRPTSGSVHLGGRHLVELSRLSEPALTAVRRERIGFVFQSFNLVPSLDVRTNVTLPLRLAGRRPHRDAVRDVLDRVGLNSHERALPAQLSGGQQQRVAIARALMTRPSLVLADEPTGALDTVTAGEVLGLFRDAVDAAGQTTVMVTHDPVAASYADAVVFLAGGRIVERAPALPAARIAERLASLAGAS